MPESLSAKLAEFEARVMELESRLDRPSPTRRFTPADWPLGLPV